jgi:hypothetical protein
MSEREKLIELLMAEEIRCFCNQKSWPEVVADYLIANGVAIPPCKIGDTVYETDGIKTYESKVKNIIYDTENTAFDKSALGKTIFLTPAEAERALKARQDI